MTRTKASRAIDAKIKELADWRGRTLAQVRRLVRQADPAVVEEVKWGGVPVWSHNGILCTGETYKSVVKLTFFKGASLKDPSGLFNSSLDGTFERLQASGAEVVQEPTEQPYGIRDCAVRDPAGNLLRIQQLR